MVGGVGVMVQNVVEVNGQMNVVGCELGGDRVSRLPRHATPAALQFEMIILD